MCVGKDNKNCATLTKVVAGIIRADVNDSFSDLLVPTSNYCRRPTNRVDFIMKKNQMNERKWNQNHVKNITINQF